jgi:hypothetical protein
MAAQAQIEGRYLGGRPPYGYKYPGQLPQTSHMTRGNSGMSGVAVRGGLPLFRRVRSLGGNPDPYVRCLARVRCHRRLRLAQAGLRNVLRPRRRCGCSPRPGRELFHSGDGEGPDRHLVWPSMMPRWLAALRSTTRTAPTGAAARAGRQPPRQLPRQPASPITAPPSGAGSGSSGRISGGSPNSGRGPQRPPWRLVTPPRRDARGPRPAGPRRHQGAATGAPGSS